MSHLERTAIAEACTRLQVAVDRIRAEATRAASEPDVEMIKRGIREIVTVTPLIAARVRNQ